MLPVIGIGAHGIDTPGTQFTCVRSRQAGRHALAQARFAPLHFIIFKQSGLANHGVGKMLAVLFFLAQVAVVDCPLLVKLLRRVLGRMLYSQSLCNLR